MRVTGSILGRRVGLAQIAAAWVNFDGTGTIAARRSLNIGSLTDNGGTGDYTLTFTRPLTATAYTVAGIHTDAGAGLQGVVQVHQNTLPGLSSVTIQSVANAGGLRDDATICVAVMGRI